jgi:hypothetical protein
MKKLVVLGCAVLMPCAAHADPVLPNFSTAVFVPGAAVNNPYFPLLSPNTRVFVAAGERFELTNLGPGPTILGVQTTIQRDRSFENGRLVEDTFDYYAQDTAGNVWYFGEDVTNFIYDANGKLIQTTNDSAWRGGVHDAKPGFIMPADPTVGFSYFQEFAPQDEAVDQALIFARGNSLMTRIAQYTNVLQILETNALEPDSREFKFYAPGVGLVMAQEGLSTKFTHPELTFLEAGPVPEPATLTLLTLGLGATVLRRRRSNVPDVSGSPTTRAA